MAVVDGVVFDGVVVAGVVAVGVSGAVVVGVVVVGVVVGVIISCSACCSCSAISAIAVSNSAISSAEAFPLLALSSSDCMASICACNAAIAASAGSSFLVQPIAALMIRTNTIMGKSFFVMIYSLQN